MAIPLSGHIKYSVVVHGSRDGVWRGRADPTPEGALHPGMVGSEPHLELSNGVVRLERAADAPSRVWRVHEPRTPVQRVAFPVGCVDTVLHEGDRLLVSRGGTGDVGVKVVRQDAPILALGAVVGPFAPAIAIADDPRVLQERFFPAYSQIAPGTRPHDLYIRFTIDGVHTDLQEGQYREQPPWQLYAHKVYRWGIPGEQSHLAIVQASLGLSRAVVIESTDVIAGRRIRIDP